MFSSLILFFKISVEEPPRVPNPNSLNMSEYVNLDFTNLIKSSSEIE